MNDKVNHPSHYNMGKIETIDYIESVTSTFTDGFEGKCVGDIIKYVSRFPFKNGIEDLNKARWYLNRLIDYEEKKTIKRVLNEEKIGCDDILQSL